MRKSTKELAIHEVGRHIQPQVVPRGFLRAYILSMISRSRQTGYSIMQSIEEKSKGFWRPGPGTIYPLLRTLAKEQLIRPIETSSRDSDRYSVSYSITEKGKLELQEMQRCIIEQKTEDHGTMAVFVELFPATFLASFYLRHLPWECNFVLDKVSKLPLSEKKRILKETRLVLETQLAKLEAQLKQKS